MLPQILQALIAKLAVAESAVLWQDLIIPFAYLCHTHLTAVLDLLGSVNVGARDGTSVLFHKWAEIADSIQGYYNIKIRCAHISSQSVSC